MKNGFLYVISAYPCATCQILILITTSILSLVPSNFIDRSRGRLQPPSTGPDSFAFAYVFSEKYQRRMLALLQWEILEPPLNFIIRTETKRPCIVLQIV